MKRIIVLLAFIFMAIAANATNIRGQLQRSTGNLSVPLSGVRVDIMIWNGSQWVDWAYALTGADGFYYFVNFTPGSLFCIKVYDKFYPTKPLTILNIAPPYYQDVPLIYT